MKKQTLILLFILAAALIRIMPHIPNFTPVTAMALFGGVYFTDKRLAYLVPVLVMLISDIFLGFSMISIFVYLAFILISFLGTRFQSISIKSILISSIAFFLITNFGVWLLGYPKSFAGLLECYTLAIPFFRNSLLGDLFYSGVMYFSFEYITKKYSKKLAQ